ncbi:MAG: TonB-dependent receptor [Acidobacteria bacterium]|nr:TonB-dependent receptor [Acidobacteriota bacterium]
MTTGLATGASNPGTKLRPQDRIAIDAGYTLMPEDFLHGHHEFKLGLTYQHDHEAWQYPANAANLGDYVLLNQTVVGVPNTPVQLRIYDMPVVPSDLAQMVGVYLKDTWRVSNSVTMNLGVRWDYDHTYLPAQSRAVSPDFPTVWPAGSFPYRTLTSWTRVSPRAGVSWDGGNLGVFKAFGGTYGYVFGAQQGINYNQNGLQYVTATRSMTRFGSRSGWSTAAATNGSSRRTSDSARRMSTGTSATSTPCPDRTCCARRAPTTFRSRAPIPVPTA